MRWRRDRGPDGDARASQPRLREKSWRTTEGVSIPAPITVPDTTLCKPYRTRGGKGIRDSEGRGCASYSGEGLSLNGSPSTARRAGMRRCISKTLLYPLTGQVQSHQWEEGILKGEEGGASPSPYCPHPADMIASGGRKIGSDTSPCPLECDAPVVADLTSVQAIGPTWETIVPHSRVIRSQYPHPTHPTQSGEESPVHRGCFALLTQLQYENGYRIPHHPGQKAVLPESGDCSPDICRILVI